jgi:hypothetical protein
MDSPDYKFSNSYENKQEHWASKHHKVKKASISRTHNAELEYLCIQYFNPFCKGKYLEKEENDGFII